MPKRLAAALALAMLLSAFPAAADILITRKSTALSAVAPGQEPRETLERTWVGSNRMAQQDDETTTIIDLEAKKLFIVNHGARTYNAVDLPIDFNKISPQLGQMIEQFGDQMKLAVNVTGGGEEEQTVAGYPTRHYTVEAQNAMGLAIEVELWVTTEIETDLKDWRRLTGEMASLQPGAADLVEKLMAIEGFPVVQQSTISMMGNRMVTREELVSIEDREAPPGTYSPPEGFVATPFNPLQNVAP